MNRKCGECLFNSVEIVELDEAGVCPKCGANYGVEVIALGEVSKRGEPKLTGLVEVAALVGVEISGRRAIVTQPYARHLHPNGCPVVTLTKVEWRKEKGFRWLYITWDTTKTVGRFDTGMDCGHAGWRADYDGVPLVEFVD